LRLTQAPFPTKGMNPKTCQLRKGDILMVCKLDRLSRSLKGVARRK
jgi:hypothetical protein